MPILIAVCFLVTTAATTGLAAEVVVVRSGVPLEEKFGSVREALAGSQPGDVIELGPGEHVGPIQTRGLRDLVIRGRPGARVVVRPKSAVAKWSRNARLGPGVYTAKTRVRPQLFAAVLRPSSVERLFVYNGVCRRRTHGVPECAEIRREASPEQDRRAEIAALAQLRFGPGIYHDDALGVVHVKLRGGDPPLDGTIHLAGVQERALYIGGGSRNITIENLELDLGGKATVWIHEAEGVTIRDSVIGGGLTAVRVDRRASGVRIERNVVRGYLHDTPHWEDFKRSRDMEGTGIDILRGGANNIVADNHIHGWFDGIGVGHIRRGSRVEEDPRMTDNADVAIRNNLIEDIYDDALELEGYIASGRVHGNLIRDSVVGIALAPRFGDGDLFIYRNRVFTNKVVARRRYETEAEPKSARPLATKLGIGLDYASNRDSPKPRGAENIRFHHNTFVSTGLGLASGFANRARADFYPRNVSWYDNVFVTQRDAAIRVTGSRSEGIALDGNLYWQAEPWKRGGRTCKRMEIRDWDTVRRSERNVFCGLNEAKRAQPAWEKGGLETKPGFLALDFDAPTVTPASGAAVVDPPSEATPPGWPDEDVAAAGIRDKGAIELTDQLSVRTIGVATDPSVPGRVVVVRGRGFDDRTVVEVGGIPLPQQVVVSTTTIVGRTPVASGRAGTHSVVAIKEGVRSKEPVFVRVP